MRPFEWRCASLGTEALEQGGRPHLLALVTRGSRRGGEQGASREKGPTEEEAVGKVPGREELRGAPGWPPPRPRPSCQGGLPSACSSLSVCLPARPPHLALGAAGMAGGPLPASLADKPPAGRPASGPRSQRLLGLQVCLELPGPPAVSLDSPALSRLISGSCCCRQKELALERKLR